MTTPPEETHAATLSVAIIEVGPTEAESWLARNPNNRNIRKAAVAAYARDMEAGQWALNGETVKFNKTGHLLDGQHRLAAVIRAGVTVPMVVVRGINDEAMDTVDAGAKRSYADMLKLQGEENSTTLAAVARRTAMWEAGQRTNTGHVQPTPREMHAFIDSHPEIRFSAEIASKLASKSLLPASIIGLCHHLFSAIDADGAGWFLSRLVDGDGLAATHPIAALRNRIVKMRVGGGRVNETEALALVIKAWNAWRANEDRTKLQLPRGGLTPENFPEPR